MIHSIAIYKRICDLLGEKGIQAKLGLKTISFGDLSLIPSDSTKLASWLPMLLVVLPGIDFPERRSDSVRGPETQVYPIELYLFRRYEPNEVTALTMHEWINELDMIWSRYDWGDRMLMPEAGLRGNAKLIVAKRTSISFDATEIFESRQDLIGRLSAGLMRAEVRLLAFTGSEETRKE